MFERKPALRPDGAALPPDRPLTLAGILDRATDLFGGREAVVCGADRVDFAELRRRADRLARGLQALGVGRGDHVVLWMPNRPEWNVALLALARIGAVAVTCNTRYKTLELQYLLQHCDAKAVLMPARFEAARVDFGAMVRAVGIEPAANGVFCAAFPHLRELVVLGDEAVPPGARRWSDVEALGEQAQASPWPQVRPTDPAVIIYSSGTTGAPKGCILSHEALYIRAVQRTRMFDWQADDRFLVTMPYFHIAGMLGPILGNLLMGSAQVVMEMFEAGAALELIERERVTVTSGVPTMFINMMAHVDYARRDLRSLRMITLGSASIPVELMRRIVSREEGGMGVGALVMYGQTETGGATHCSHPGDPVELLVSTAGTVLPGLADRIVDPRSGLDCPPGQEGQIWVRGPGMMTGYYKMPDASAEKMADGWLRTGDIGVKDEGGYLRVTGRLADTIIVGGFNTYPAEIENYLAHHPKVLESAVIGVPDAVMGEVVMAFVIPRPGEDLAPEDIQQFLRSRIANFKVPRFVEVVDELPMTASGKVQKFKLRERFLAGVSTA